MTERTGSITVNDLLKAITPETFQELGLQDLNFSLGFEIASKMPLGKRLTMLNREDLRKLGQLTGLRNADEIVFDTAEGEAGLGFPYPYASRIAPGDTWFSYLKQFNGHLKVHTVNIEPETKNDDWQLLIVEGVTDVFARKYVEGEGQEETVKEFRRAIEAKDSTKARELLSLVYQKLDKAAKRNIIHQNTAARKKSRLSRLAAKL